MRKTILTTASTLLILTATGKAEDVMRVASVSPNPTWSYKSTFRDANKLRRSRGGSGIPLPGCLPSTIRGMIQTIESKFGRVQIISAYRPGAKIAGTNKASYHASCRAVDFHPPRGKYSAVLAYLRNNWSGGVGTYSGSMHHIHIDNGADRAFHTHVGGRRRHRHS